MALSPIQAFQTPQTSLAQILQGGSQTLSGIMDQAIQLGRNMSDKQLAQERDMLAMRQQETNLAQRRAENLQQNWEDSFNFARQAFESDRNYGLAERQESRASAHDLFQRQDSKARLGIDERDMDLKESTQKFREQEFRRKQQMEESERVRLSSLLVGGGQTAEATPAEYDPYGLNQFFREPMSPAEEPAAAPKKGMDAATAGNQVAALEELLRNPASTGQQREAAAVRVAQLKRDFPEMKPLTPYQQSRQENSEASAARAAANDALSKIDKQLDSLVADTKAFQIQPEEGYDPKTKEAVTLASAVEWNKNRLKSEIAAAERYASADEFYNASGIKNANAVNKRREFWSLVQKRKKLLAGGGAMSKDDTDLFYDP